MKMNQQQLDSLLLQKLRNELVIASEARESAKRKMEEPEKTQRVYECDKRVYEAALLLGDFSTALICAHTPEQLDFIRALSIAIDRPDTQVCECEDDTFFNGKQTATLPRFIKWRRLFQPHLNKFIWVYRCTKCGFLNAAVKFEPLRALNAAREAGKTIPDSEVFS